MAYDSATVINIQQQSELLRLENTAINDNSFTWSVYSTNDSESEDSQHQYESISETILVDLFGGPQVFQWKAETLTKFQMCKNTNFHDPDDDAQDLLYGKNVARGQLQSANSFYFNVKDKDVYFDDFDDTPLHYYSYDPRINVFYGKNSKNDADKVEVSEEWLRETVGDEFVEHVKVSTDYSKVKYVEVFPGDPMDYNTTIASSPSAPIIEYQQKNKRSCSFSSLASTLYYLGYCNTAEIINNSQEIFFEQLANKAVCE
jgi:hypothetical protein